MKKYIFLLFVLSCLGANAQGLCDNPPVRGGFTLQFEKGCAPFTVRVKNTSGTSQPSTIKYVFIYNGEPETALSRLLDNEKAGRLNDSAYVYQQAGTYTILQVGSKNGNDMRFCGKVQVIEPTAPKLQVVACFDGRVNLTIVNDSVANQYDQFRIDWGDGTQKTILRSAIASNSHVYTTSGEKPIAVVGLITGSACESRRANAVAKPVLSSGTEISIRRVTMNSDGTADVRVNLVAGFKTILQLKGPDDAAFRNTLNAPDSTGSFQFRVVMVDPRRSTCFQLTSVDKCGTTVVSEQVCTVSLDVTTRNGQNTLQWLPYAPSTGVFREYSLFRDKINAQSTLQSYKKIANRNTVADVDITTLACEEYSYQLVVVLRSGAESYSELKKIKTNSDDKVSEVRNLFVSVEETDDKIRIFADPPATGSSQSFKATVLRSENGKDDFREIVTLENKLNYVDERVDPANQSYCYKIIYENRCGVASEAVEPVCTILLTAKGSSEINWTAQNPFTTDVKNYLIQKIDEAGFVVSETDLGGNTSFAPNFTNDGDQLFRYRVKAFDSRGVLSSFSNTYILKRGASMFVPDAFTPNGDNNNDTFVVSGQFLDSFRMWVYNRWGEVVFETKDRKNGWDGTKNGAELPAGTYIYRVEVLDSLGQSSVKTGNVVLMR